MSVKLNMGRKSYLFSRISVGAKPMSSFARIKECLRPYPSMELERDGNSLAYVIGEKDGRDHFFLLELDKESIAVSIYSKHTPMRHLQEAMLRLLGVLHTLSSCYDVEMNSLYPYLIMTIAEQQLDTMQYARSQTRDAIPDTILSRRLMATLSENASLKEERSKLAETLKRVVLRAVVLSSFSDHSVGSIAGRLGIGKKEVVAALDGAESAGYRVVSTGKGTFKLVRL